METGIPTNQEVITQSAEQTEPEQNEPKTFTQEDVDRIVSKRVARYSDYEELKQKAAKYDEQVEASKSDLQKATEKAESLQAELNAIKEAEQIRKMRDEVGTSKGVPAALLTGKTPEECADQAEALLTWAKEITPNGYPRVPDGGDPGTSKSARDQFADWLQAQI